MTRRLLIVLSALSLLLCVAVVVLWARSYWHDEPSIGYAHWGGDWKYRKRWIAATTGASGGSLTRWSVGYDKGVCLSHAARQVWGPRETVTLFDEESFRRRGLHLGGRVAPPSPLRLGFGYARREVQGGWVLKLAVPHWALVLLSLGAPLGLAWSHYRRRTRRPGHCLACGYDLRATPKRCPECGHVPASPSP